MAKKKIIIIIAAVAVIAGGAMMFLGGGEDPKYSQIVPIAPIPMTEPFIINLADADGIHYVKLSVAVQLKPMKYKYKDIFMHGAGGGHGKVVTGPEKVAAYPPFRDAVIEVTSRFRSDELVKPSGKERLRQALLDRFEEVAVHDKKLAAKPLPGEIKDPGYPPYYVNDVFFNEFAVQ
jgi:flagellar basal body-associated protein FliL